MPVSLSSPCSCRCCSYFCSALIEFGWVLGLNNDVRHGAREGARFAAVDGGSNAAINTYTCQSMEPLGGISFSDLDIELTRLDTNGVSGIQIGDTGRIAISADVTSRSGLNFMDALLPDTLSSTIDFRIEQVPSWSDGTALGVTC